MEKVLVSQSVVGAFSSIYSYSMSFDGSLVMIMTNASSVWRYSVQGSYYLVDTNSQVFMAGEVRK